jgi:putative DNA primase/helicase
VDLVKWSLAVEAGLHRPPLIKVNGKAPLDRDWPTGPFDQPDEWRARLEHHQGNVGVVLGRGVCALDVDSYKAEADDSWDRLRTTAGLTTETVTAITGRGGRHYFYAYDQALLLPSVPLGPRGYPGIELKADGGMVVIEPSLHPDTGKAYAFEIGYGPGEIEPALLQPVFFDLSAPPPRSKLGSDDHEVARILVEHYGGHSVTTMRDGSLGVWRPGKDKDRRASISIGSLGPGVFHVWTDGWPPFVQEKTYDLGQLRRMAGITEVPRFRIPEAISDMPEGYRLWRDGDDVMPAPTLGPDAYHGLIGAFLRLLEGQTEGHPAAIGAHVLPCLGTMLGREVAYRAGTEIHFPKVNAIIVGPTSAGVKGVSENAAMLLVEDINRDFVARHSLTGVASGEAVIHEMRDDADPPSEKRRIVMDAEFSAVLKVVRRDGSILGDVLRKVFDNRPLQNRTKSAGTEVASGHHLSILGATTPSELRSFTEEISILNGFANRFLYVWSELSVLLPVGGSIDAPSIKRLAEEFVAVQTWVRQKPAVNGTSRWYSIAKDSPAFDVWNPFYDRRPGLPNESEMMTAITGRQVAHGARIALIYAVLDCCDHFEPEHIRAAIAWCDYCVATIRKVFTSGLGGKVGRLLDAIRASGEVGMDGAAQTLLFRNTLKAAEVAVLRAEMEEQHLIVSVTRPTAGRPRLTSYAISKRGLRS